MLIHYLKLIARSLIELRNYTFVNIFGLAIGLASCLLILQYLRSEYGFDRHHGDDIYRVSTEFIFSDQQRSEATSPPALAAAIKRDFPEVMESTRVFKAPGADKHLVTVGDRSFFEENVLYADPSFFELLTYEFAAGDPVTALNNPFSVVVSTEVAAKLFAEEQAIGRTLEIESNWGIDLYSITGVFSKSTYKTHIDGDYYISAMSGALGDRFYELQEWAGNNFLYSYIQLQEGTDPSSLESKLPEWLDVYAGEQLAQLGFGKRHFLEPMQSLYLYSGLDTMIGPTGSSTYFYTLGMIAVLILVIACINFTNLSTAKALLRAKEVGVRKVVGASNSALIKQFMLEAFAYTMVAMAVAYLLAEFAAPLFSAIIDRSITISLFQNGFDSSVVAILAVIITLMIGAYPALYLASFKPVDILRGYVGSKVSTQTLRKGLVSLQFIVSIALIQGILIVDGQMSYIGSKDLGFDKTSKLVIPNNSSASRNNVIEMKNRLLQHPAISRVGSSSTYPSAVNLEDGLMNSPGRSAEDARVGYMSFVDADYMELMEFNFLSGRNFDLSRPDDSGKVIISEAAALGVGYDQVSALGNVIQMGIPTEFREFEIIGVVEDFHAFALHEEIRGQIFFWDDGNGLSNAYLIADVLAGDMNQLLNFVEDTWRSINPGDPFEFFFLDEAIQEDYATEQRMSDMVFSATVLALLISCFGLLGITAFAAERRRKEIALRKTLGATIANVVMMLSRDFLGLVLVAFCIATPIAWYAMNQWLAGFYYHAEMQWWIFILGGVMATVIALLTISWQAIKSAVSSPVVGLRVQE